MLLRDTLLIDGITRGGKSLVGLLMRAFVNSEKVEICYPIEHVISGVYLNHVERKFALDIIKSILNERIYDLQVSRNVNFRELETTSAVWSEFKGIYQQRLKEVDGDVALNKIKESGKLSPFITHELFLELGLLLEIPQLHVLEVIRNPFDIFWSWNKKNWAQRMCSDPRSWRITTSGKTNVSVPWFVAECPEYWEGNDEVNRIALTIAYLTKRQIEKINSFENETQKIDVCITDILFDQPEVYLQRWSSKHNLQLRKNWRDIYTLHKLPRKPLVSYEANLNKLASILSEHSFFEMRSAYEEFKLKNKREHERLL